MSPSEVVGATVGIVSVTATVILGGLAIWQSRENAKDARAASDRTADLQREFAVDLNALQETTRILGGLLGTQIDRLTTFAVQSPQLITETLRLFRESTAAVPQQQRTLPATSEEKVRDLVAIAVWAGLLNIFVRGLVDELVKRGAWKTGGGFDPVLIGSHDAFTNALRQLDESDPDALRRANALDKVRAFRDNYLPNLRRAWDPTTAGENKAPAT